VAFRARPKASVSLQSVARASESPGGANRMSKTTLFQRTEANIETFEKELEHLNSSVKTNASTIVDDKRRHDGERNYLLCQSNYFIASSSMFDLWLIKSQAIHIKMLFWHEK
jgi:hypothetical protein